jgi:hypothetical protein
MSFAARIAALTTTAVVLLAACSSSAPAPVDAGISHDAAPALGPRVPLCHLPAPTMCPDPAVHYADIVPIVQQRCLPCHDGRSTHWPLTDYRHVADWQDIIRSAMLNCTMPPGDAGIPMPTEERMTVLHWIRCGGMP